MSGLEAIGYQDFLKQKEEAAKRGRLLGIGISTMTEPLGAGNSREYDILGIKMFDSAELKIHMTGKALLRTGAKTQGQGHETTWAQIVAHELGIPAEDILVEEGDTDTAPFGMGTYASRSTPVAGAAVAMVSRKIRAKARKIAAHLLEISEEDVEWELGRFYVRSQPERGVTIQECAMAAYSNMPDGMEPGLENVAYYDPPNLTWPFACYIVTVEVDPETGVWDVLRLVAVDDCGVRINPMIVEGQIMGGLTEAYAMANMQFITFDAEGNCIGSNFTDYLLPTAWETPGFELHEVVTPCPHHPIGAKGDRGVRRRWRAGRIRQRRDRRPEGHRVCATSTCRCSPTVSIEALQTGTGRQRSTPGEDRRDVSAQPADGWRMIEKASDLARQGVEFALATVVWRQAPSSGHQGSRAIITADGQIHGWIGGACAEPVVIREAQRAIEERSPRLILLGDPDQFGEVARRHDVRPDVVPVRGRAAAIRRARTSQPPPGGRGPVPDGRHLGGACGRGRLARRLGRCTRLQDSACRQLVGRGGRHPGSR